MKILHICSTLTDGLGYQENLLTRYHKKMGLEVDVISTKWGYNTDGKFVYRDINGGINQDGVNVIRLEIRGSKPYGYKFRRLAGFQEALEKSAPDILFVHGCQFLDIDQIVKYIKQHSGITVYVDNHADFSNSATNWLSKNILHKVIWRRCAQQIAPYVKKFYGVLPARVDFLTDVYGLPKEKCELLVMGADDELVEKAKSSKARANIRARYGIREDDFLVMTGGKINHYRPETLHLMETVTAINRENVKLLVFGTISEDMKDDFDRLCEDKHIIYAGWLQAVDTYDYFAAADLMVFPGLHSVMWEQAVAQGKACVFRDIEGFHHVDIGGNVKFAGDVSIDGLKKILLDIIDDPSKYQHMKSIAEDRGMTVFSYKEIARRSIR